MRNIWPMKWTTFRMPLHEPFSAFPILCPSHNIAKSRWIRKSSTSRVRLCISRALGTKLENPTLRCALNDDETLVLTRKRANPISPLFPLCRIIRFLINIITSKTRNTALSPLPSIFDCRNRGIIRKRSKHHVNLICEAEGLCGENQYLSNIDVLRGW